jgi:hypothetical protein
MKTTKKKLLIRWMKINKDVLLITSLTLVFSILSYYLTWEKIEILTALLLSGISLSVSVRKQKSENDKVFDTLFERYNKVFNEKYAFQMMEIVSQYFNWRTSAIQNGELMLIIEYYRFCSQFYIWYKKWRITEEIWGTRKNDMMFYLYVPQVLDVIQSELQMPWQFYWLFDDELDYFIKLLKSKETQ